MHTQNESVSKFVFLKTHKVAGTAVMQMLTRVLRETRNLAQCDSTSVVVANGHTSVRLPGATSPVDCGACLDHVSRLPVSAAIRMPSSATAQCSARAVCPFWIPNARVRILVLLREPVERAHARYHYERANGWCRVRAVQEALTCASDALGFVQWALRSDTEILSLGLWRSTQKHFLAETVHVLGGGHAQVALALLARLDVVGVTERLQDTLVVLAKTWQLPLARLQGHLKHVNTRVVPRPQLNHSLVVWLRSQNGHLQQEEVLFAYAQERLTRDLATARAQSAGWRVPAFGCEHASIR